MTADIRANSVEIVKEWRAYCRVVTCGWYGQPRDSYQAANADRQAHLQEHRDGAA